MATPWKLAGEALRPVERRSAVRFHHLSVFLSVAPVALVGGVIYWRDWMSWVTWDWQVELSNSNNFHAGILKAMT